MPVAPRQNLMRVDTSHTLEGGEDKILSKRVGPTESNILTRRCRMSLGGFLTPQLSMGGASAPEQREPSKYSQGSGVEYNRDPSTLLTQEGK